MQPKQIEGVTKTSAEITGDFVESKITDEIPSKMKDKNISLAIKEVKDVQENYNSH